MAILAVMLAATGLHAQGTQADYDRANHLAESVKNKVFRATIAPHWLGDNKRFWYRNDLAEGHREFVLVDAPAGTRGPAFDHTRSAAALAKSAGKEVAAEKLPIERIEFSESSDVIVFDAFGKGWECNLGDYTLKEHAPPKPLSDPPRRFRRGESRQGPFPNAKSPDGKWLAFVKEHNVYLRSLEDGEESQLSDDGKSDDAYKEVFFWSPDSKYLVAVRTKAGEDHKVYLVESSPPRPTAAQAALLRLPQAGRPHSAHQAASVRRRREETDSHQRRTVSAIPGASNEIRWDRDSKRFTFLYNQRGHQVLRVDRRRCRQRRRRARSSTRQSKTFIDYAGKQFYRYLDDTGEIIWMSERDGWNHLYLYDAQDRRGEEPDHQRRVGRARRRSRR